MVKRRPVVIISPRLRRRPDLVTVIPLSTTVPVPVEAHHCEIVLAVPLPAPFQAAQMWAKCDMVCTVSLARLDRFKDGRAPHSPTRRFRTGKVSTEQLATIRRAVLNALGMASLTVHV